MTVDTEIVLSVTELLTFGQTNLFANEIEPGDRFGYGMLDLQTGIDLEEPEVLAVEQELHGAGR